MAGLTKVKGSGLATGAATASLVGIDDNATSTAITIDASENVGIGTATPAAGAKAHIYSSTANVDALFVEKTSDEANSALRVKHVSASDSRYIARFENGTNDIMRIGAAGTVTLGIGNLVIGTSGKGIDFSAATPDGTGSTGSEVLDDYEEGTWTPTFLSTDASWTYSTQKGNYTKTGNTVHFRAYIATTAASGTLSNGLQISGLPFAVVNTTNSLGNVTIGYAYKFDMSQTTGGTGVPVFAAGRTEENTSIISIHATRNDAVVYSITAEATNSNPCRLIVDGFYFTS